MADTFPESHTTATRGPNVVTRTKPVADVSKIKTTSGILYLVEIGLSVITFICCVSGCNPHPHMGWGAFVSFTAILLCIGFLVALLFNVQDMLPSFPLRLFELIVFAIWTIFYLIAGSVCAAIADYSRWYEGLGVKWYATPTCSSSAGAGAFFSYICMLVFGFDTVLKFKEWRKSRTAPAARSVVTTTTPAGTVISPS